MYPKTGRWWMEITVSQGDILITPSARIGALLLLVYLNDDFFLVSLGYSMVIA
jgi:hypothetical protein